MGEGLQVALIAALAGLVGGWLQHFLAGHQWSSQQRWSTREKYYTELLALLTRMRLSIEQRYRHYATSPRGVEHDPTPKYFEPLMAEEGEAHRALQRMMGPAQLYLSSRAIAAIEHLDRATTDAAEDALHAGEYLETALPLVRNAELEVAYAARLQLGLTTPQMRVGSWLIRIGIGIGIAAVIAAFAWKGQTATVDWARRGYGLGIAIAAIGAGWWARAASLHFTRRRR